MGERFEKLVEKHKVWKQKRHHTGDYFYSDYDSMAGMALGAGLITWIFSFFADAIIFITLFIFLKIMNKVEITKKKEKVEEAQFKERSATTHK